MEVETIDRKLVIKYYETVQRKASILTVIEKKRTEERYKIKKEAENKARLMKLLNAKRKVEVAQSEKVEV